MLGVGPVADELGIARSTVWRWTQPEGKGTNGIVPACYHRPLLTLAQQRGKRLTSDDLVNGRLRTGVR